MNTTESLRLWLRQCPTIGKTDRFNVDFAGKDPTEYTIYSSPSTIKYNTDILGNVWLDPVQEVNYVFASTFPFSMNILQNLNNLGFFDEIIRWMREQNKTKNFPEIAEGTVISLMPTLTPYVFEANSEAGRYQIQLKIKYRIKE